MKNILKKIFGINKFNFDELSKNKFLTDMWINVEFTVDTQFRSGTKIDKMIDEIESQKQTILEVLSGNLVVSGMNEKYNLTIINEPAYNKKKYSYILKIKFIEFDKKLKKSVLRYKDKSDTRKYGFSPIDMLKFGKFLSAFEYSLCNITNTTPREKQNIFSFYENKPFFVDTDCIMTIASSVENKLKLYRDYPKIFKEIFGWDGKRLLDWTFDKKDNDAHMKKYCKEVAKIVRKLGIKYETM